MKKLVMLLFTICLFGCYSTQRDCKDYKTGTFFSEVTIDGQTYTSTFTRTDNIQVETYDGKKDSSQVRWINDCEVVFRTINPKSMAEEKDVHLKILTTTDSSYTFEYSYVGETKKQKGTAYRATVN